MLRRIYSLTGFPSSEVKCLTAVEFPFIVSIVANFWPQHFAVYCILLTFHSKFSFLFFQRSRNLGISGCCFFRFNKELNISCIQKRYRRWSSYRNFPSVVCQLVQVFRHFYTEPMTFSLHNFLYHIYKHKRSKSEKIEVGGVIALLVQKESPDISSLIKRGRSKLKYKHRRLLLGW